MAADTHRPFYFLVRSLKELSLFSVSGLPGCPEGFLLRRESGGVLASDFRVHGTKGLRVVDASVFPRIPGFFIVSSIYMIAEKAAAMVRHHA